MRLLPTLTFSALALTLAACSTPAEREAARAAQEAADHQECADLGFKKGTPAYGDCRLRFKEMRSNERAGRNAGAGYSIGYGYYGRGGGFGLGRRW